MELYWTGHAGFKIKDRGSAIYIDPYELDDGEEANFIFITHTHHDHLDLDSIRKIATERTVIVGSEDLPGKLEGISVKEVVTLKPGELHDGHGFKVRTYPAYNTDKEFHPKENGWLGLHLVSCASSVYHAGDLDDLSENYGISCDIALVPVSGKYVMTAEEAAHYVSHLECNIAVPMHYGSIVGSVEDAKRFAELVGDKAKIPTVGENLLELAHQAE